MQSLNAITADDDQYDYAFAWLTDTQFNVESDPRIFKEQLDWIVDHADENKIKYVFHTGDIVNRTFEEKQWELADDYMKILEENEDRKSTRLNSSHVSISYAVFCLKKK